MPNNKEAAPVFGDGERIIPYLSLPGNAEEAMKFYVSIFPGSRILSIKYISKNDRGEEGKVLNGAAELCGRKFMFMDIEKPHCPELTWAFSILFMCGSEDEFDTLFSGLSANGSVLMGPEPLESGQINFRKCAWVTDMFEVTWQLVWE